MSASQRKIAALEQKDQMNSRILAVLLGRLGGSVDVSTDEWNEQEGRITMTSRPGVLKFSLVRGVGADAAQTG